MELCRGRFRGDVVEVIVEAFVKFNSERATPSDTAALVPQDRAASNQVQVHMKPGPSTMMFSQSSTMIPEW
jgi:hypothetical protein